MKALEMTRVIQASGGVRTADQHTAAGPRHLTSVLRNRKKAWLIFRCRKGKDARKTTKYSLGWDQKTRKVYLAVFLGSVGSNSVSQRTLFRVDSRNSVFHGVGNHLKNQ